MRKLGLLTVLAAIFAITSFSQSPAPKPAPAAAATAGNASWYARPSATQRRKDYVKSVVGPLALVRYTLSAGVATARNTPREWEGTWEGFGRRFANSAGKSFISNSVQFGLDEALRVDSKFYKSRDRRVSARLQNAVLSVVTARNEKGKRVIGVPNIAGSFASNIIPATTWYPKRYGVKDGMRGGAISLGINAGFNLFREFVWK